MRLIDADRLIDALNLRGCYKYKNPKAYDTLMLYEILQAIEDQQMFDETFKMAIESLEIVEKNSEVIKYCGTCSNRKKCIKSDL